MKLGGLFSGVGGFELAWTRLGGEVAWMCEIDRSAQKVLRARFPHVPIYDDVTQLDPAEVEAVDVLTGGSPCQGFSVAGSRSGLEHGESRLFADYIRIMDGLATRGLQFALWENVPGVLSIQNDDGEMTFEHVVAALVGAAEPVRLDRNVRWNTGMAARSGRAVAWRVLDSRYFGVAQRRRRIFACVAFGHSCEDRAGRTLLAVSEGVSGDFASGDETGQGAADGVAERVGVPCVSGTLAASGSGTSRTSGNGNFMDFVIPQVPAVPELMRKVRSDDFVGDETSSTLAARDHKDYGDLVVEPAVLLTMREGKDGGGKGPLMSEEESLTLATGNGQVLFEPQPFRKSSRVSTADSAETWVDDGLANTLNSFDVGDVRTTHAIVETASYGVRRLTPVECERLQAFPDGWTEPAGSDSARYKAMGNAVTVNVVQWILGRMIGNMR
jgi:DNA (cytosine-5)-methyltransferase 1